MELSLSNKLKIVVGQQMQLSLRVLQMSNLQLEEYMRSLFEENPLLAEKAPAERPPRSLSAAENAFRQSGARYNLEDAEFLQAGLHSESFRDYVLAQINMTKMPQKLRRELTWLCYELDERGYLPESPGDLKPFGGSADEYAAAVEKLQSLEPAGVGARSVQECLCLQLKRGGVTDELPYILCRGYLDRLARGQLNSIAKELNISTAKVDQAKKAVLALNPRITNGFAGGNAAHYVIPDVEIIRDGDSLEAVYADKYLPSYIIDPYYSEMLRDENLSGAEREYIQDKLSQAQQALGIVEKRRDTVLACAKFILEKQRAFFLDGSRKLVPVSMTEAAEQLGVHVSTVSRTVHEKYILCEWGLFPMDHFFSREVKGSMGGTTANLEETIKDIISREDPQKPLSDMKIAEMVSAMGLEVSRRTVAKYRDKAAIPPASARRER